MGPHGCHPTGDIPMVPPQVVSLGLVAVGLYARLLKQAEAATACLALDPALLLLLLGVLVFLVTFCGCVGALRENICLLQAVRGAAGPGRVPGVSPAWCPQPGCPWGGRTLWGAPGPHGEDAVPMGRIMSLWGRGYHRGEDNVPMGRTTSPWGRGHPREEDTVPMWRRMMSPWGSCCPLRGRGCPHMEDTVPVRKRPSP